ncbi:hypothetical protein P10159_3944 [Citrobacter portucalensis]|nr:hypothetical protein P10159_3944 [Citrobacter portucalensis]
MRPLSVAPLTPLVSYKRLKEKEHNQWVQNHYHSGSKR